MKLVIDQAYATDGKVTRVHLAQASFSCLLKGASNPVPRKLIGVTADGTYVSELDFDGVKVISKNNPIERKSRFFVSNEDVQAHLVPMEHIADPVDESKFERIAVAA